MIENRKILVTGSSDGIGRSISNFLLDSGATVVGIARNHKKFNPKSNNYHKYIVDLSDKQILINQNKRKILLLQLLSFQVLKSQRFLLLKAD